MTKDEYTALLESSIKSKDERNIQLQLDNAKLRKALQTTIEAMNGQHKYAQDVAMEALSTTSQPESTVRNNRTTQKPLSDEEINIITKEYAYASLSFARAIEKSHGIGK